MIKFQLAGANDRAEIFEIEITRETEHSVFIERCGKEWREDKHSYWAEYYDTWDEAWAALTAVASNRVAAARQALASANDFAGSVKGMRRARVAEEQT